MSTHDIKSKKTLTFADVTSMIINIHMFINILLK